MKSQYSLEELEHALDKAVLGLFQDPPLAGKSNHSPSTFLTTIYASLVRVWDHHIPTACTNGKRLQINPDFFMGLSLPMRTTLLAHETWHVAFLHCDPDRRQDRDPRRWNWACDFAINNMLQAHGFIFEPGYLLDPRFDDMSAEQIYTILEQEDAVFTSVLGDDFEDMAEPAIDRHEAIGTLVRAATMHRMSSSRAGKLPGDLETMIDEILNPKLPWYALLAKFFNEKSEQGYDWARPSRRYLPHGLHLPSGGGQDGLSRILWACDDSGSMGEDDLKRMNAEMKGVKDRLKPKAMTVVSFDTQIQDHWEFTEENDLKRLKFTGGGGTDIQPAFDFALAMKERPQLIVVMSDLECQIPPNPGIPVLWVRFGGCGEKPDYGHIINVDN